MNTVIYFTSHLIQELLWCCKRSAVLFSITGDGNIKPTTVVIIVTIVVLVAAAVICVIVLLLWKKRKRNGASKLSLRNTVIPVHCIHVVSQNCFVF